MNPEFYTDCECGGLYVGRSGFTMDSFPAHYPVKCIECGNEGYSYLITETDSMGWSPRPERTETE